MSNKNQIGVITEQGFVMGNNLGYKPIKENLDKDNTKEINKKNEKDKKNKK